MNIGLLFFIDVFVSFVGFWSCLFCVGAEMVKS